MLRRYAMVRKVAREISGAANGAFEGYASGEKVDESDITGLMLGAIGERIRSREFGGVTWSAHILTSSGPGAEEKRHGADFMGVLDADLPDYKVKKGFLVQAKKAEPGDTFKKDQWKCLTSQCEKITERTLDSFVFVYSRKEGIRVFPALSVLELKSMNIFDLYHHSVQNFFENHLECFIGDRRLNSPDIEKLDALADFPVRRVLHLTARVPE